MWPFTVGKDFVLRNSLCGAVKVTNMLILIKINTFDFEIRFRYLIVVGLVGADMTSSMYIDNKNKDVLVLGKGPADSIDETTSTAEREYSINFTKQQKKFCLSLHYNGVNSNIFVNCVEIWQVKNMAP